MREAFLVFPPRGSLLSARKRKFNMIIVGLNAFHGDSAAAALRDGILVSAVEEERFTRVKHWTGFPSQSLQVCLRDSGYKDADRDSVVFSVSRKPDRYLARKALLALSHPRSLGRSLSRIRNFSAVRSLGERIQDVYGGRGTPPQVYKVEHHLAHIVSSFFCCPWDEAMCITVDGFGDFVSTMLAVGRGNSIEVLKRVHYPHSLGLFYTALTQYLGFPKYGDEYKVMGLAAYGDLSFVPQIRKLVPLLGDGTFCLDLSYFSHLSEGVDMTWEGGEPLLGKVFSRKLEKLLGPSRRTGEELSQKHMDVAASVQAVYEERFFSLIRATQKRTRLRKLALAGGCAMNSLANGKIFNQADIEEIYIQPAAGDAGTALGSALYVQHCVYGNDRNFVMEHACWGPGFDESRIRQAVAEAIPGSNGGSGRFGDFDVQEGLDEVVLVRDTAHAIAEGQVVGWYQGRSEWGPRALGNRSILADPRRSDMKEILNLKIKRRESFRPFAPSILEEKVADWFSISYPDPFMAKVYPFRSEKREVLPAVTHVDGTGRLQTVSKEIHPLYWGLIKEFERLTGVPVILNTSFNENEPIVNTPEEALDCFLRTKMDRIVLGRTVVKRV